MDVNDSPNANMIDKTQFSFICISRAYIHYIYLLHIYNNYRPRRKSLGLSQTGQIFYQQEDISGLQLLCLHASGVPPRVLFEDNYEDHNRDHANGTPRKSYDGTARYCGFLDQGICTGLIFEYKGENADNVEENFKIWQEFIKKEIENLEHSTLKAGSDLIIPAVPEDVMGNNSSIYCPSGFQSIYHRFGMFCKEPKTINKIQFIQEQLNELGRSKYCSEVVILGKNQIYLQPGFEMDDLMPHPRDVGNLLNTIAEPQAYHEFMKADHEIKTYYHGVKKKSKSKVCVHLRSGYIFIIYTYHIYILYIYIYYIYIVSKPSTENDAALAKALAESFANEEPTKTRSVISLSSTETAAKKSKTTKISIAKHKNKAALKQKQKRWTATTNIIAELCAVVNNKYENSSYGNAAVLTNLMTTCL